MKTGPKAAARLAVAAMMVATLVGAVSAGADQGTGAETVLVSRAGAHGAGGDGNSITPSISADGRYVAFASRAKNLSPAAKSGKLEIYVRDMQTGAVTLVSRASGADGGVAESDAHDPSISADGRYVAFSSFGENLSSEDTSAFGVFVRDLATQTTILVSRATGATGPAASSSSFDPSISADGRHVAFESNASNLSADDGNGARDVFVRDLDTGVTDLVSRVNGATGVPGGDFSSEPSISSDGRYVAFSSRAALTADDFDQESFPQDVFVRDRLTGTTILASRKTGAAGAPSDVESQQPAISADGLHVAFASDAKLTGQRGYERNVFVRDIAAGTTKLVSVGDEGLAGDAKRNPSISADGRYVAFETRGNKLSPVDAEGRVDVFVRDMQKGLTVTLPRLGDARGPRRRSLVQRLDFRRRAGRRLRFARDQPQRRRRGPLLGRPSPASGLRERAAVAELRRANRDDHRHWRQGRPEGNQAQGRDRRPRRG